MQTKASLPGRTHKLSSITRPVCTPLESSVSWLPISMMCDWSPWMPSHSHTQWRSHWNTWQKEKCLFISLGLPLYLRVTQLWDPDRFKPDKSIDGPTVAHTAELYRVRKYRLVRLKRLHALILYFMERIMEPMRRLFQSTFIQWNVFLEV